MQNSKFGELAPKGKISLQERDIVGTMHLAKVLGLSTEGQVAPSVATDHAAVLAFHLFLSTWIFSSLFMSKHTPVHAVKIM